MTDIAASKYNFGTNASNPLPTSDQISELDLFPTHDISTKFLWPEKIRRRISRVTNTSKTKPNDSTTDKAISSTSTSTSKLETVPQI